MRRARAVSSETGQSLFSFIAVLLCTIGGLILVLVMLAQRARAQPNDFPSAGASAGSSSSDELPSIDSDREMVQLRLRQLNTQREMTQADLEKRRLELGQVEDHMLKLQGELEALRSDYQNLYQASLAEGQTQKQHENQLLALTQQIADRKAELDHLRSEVGDRPVNYSVVPYVGGHGTYRRPIYIECRRDAVILQPEGTIFTVEDFEEPIGPGNPLAAAVRAAHEYIARTAPGGARGSSYPLLLVRPDGIVAYGAVRAALRSWDAEFGYELIDSEWDLTFETPDTDLAELEDRAAAQARERQAAIIRSAPRVYGKKKNGPADSAGGERVARGGRGGGGSGSSSGRGNGNGAGGGDGVAGSGGHASGGDYQGEGNSALPGGGGNGTAGGSGNGTLNGDGTGHGGNGPGGYGPEGFGPGGSGPGGYGPGGNGPYGPGGGGGPGGDALADGSGGQPGSHAYGSGYRGGAPGDGSGNGYGGGEPGGTGNGGTGNGGPGYGARGNGGSGYGGNGFGDGQGGGEHGAGEHSGGGSGGEPKSGGNGQRGVGGGGSAQGDFNRDRGGYGGGSGEGEESGEWNEGGSSHGGAGNHSATGNHAGGQSRYPWQPGYEPPPNESGNSNDGNSNHGNSNDDRGSTQSGGSGSRSRYTSNQSGGSGGNSSAGMSGGSGGSGGAAGGGAFSPNFEYQPQRSPTSLAKKRGSNWGLPQSAGASFPVTRPIHIQCYPDHIRLMSSNIRAPQPKDIPLDGRTESAVDELVSSIWSQMQGWGMAGNGMYWKPVLTFDVADGAEHRVAELKALLEDSGLEIKERPLATRTPTPDPKLKAPKSSAPRSSVTNSPAPSTPAQIRTWAT